MNIYHENAQHSSSGIIQISGSPKIWNWFEKILCTFLSRYLSHDWRAVRSLFRFFSTSTSAVKENAVLFVKLQNCFVELQVYQHEGDYGYIFIFHMATLHFQLLFQLIQCNVNGQRKQYFFAIEYKRFSKLGSLSYSAVGGEVQYRECR